MVLKNSKRVDDATIKANADVFISEKTTIREVAKKVGISKSALHSRLTKNLPTIDKVRYVKVRMIIDKNISTRHIRGGMSTKHKFERLKEEAKIQKCIEGRYNRHYRENLGEW